MACCLGSCAHHSHSADTAREAARGDTDLQAEVADLIASGDLGRAELLTRAVLTSPLAPLKRAQLQHALADVLVSRGRIREAAEWTDAAIASYSEGGSDQAAVLLTRALQGRISAHLGRFDEAIAIHTDVLVRLRDLPQTSSSQLAWAHANLGRTLWARAVSYPEASQPRSEGLAGAVTHLRTGLDLCNASLSAPARQQAIIRSQYAEAVFDSGDVDASVREIQLAWNSIAADAGAPSSAILPIALARARVLLHVEPSAGLDALRKYLDDDFAFAISQLPRQTDDEKRVQLARREEAVRLACDAALKSPDRADAARLAAEAVWTWKGLRVDAARAELDVLRDSGTQLDQERFRAIIRGRQALAARTLAESVHAAEGNTRDPSESQGQVLRRFASDLRAGPLASHPSAIIAKPTLPDIQECLDSQDVIVEYVVHRPWRRASSESDRLIAFATSRSMRDVRLFDLGPIADIERIVGRVRRSIAASARAISDDPDNAESILSAREPMLARALSDLHARIWAPLHEVILGSRCAFVGVDGPLSAVPFDALARWNDPAGSWSYRVEDPAEPAISRIHTARDLIWWREVRERAPRATNQILLIGDPDFGSVSSNRKGGGMPAWRPVHSLGPFLKSLRGQLQASFPRTDVALHAGSDATEDLVMRAENPLGVVLATHGWFWDAADPDDLDERAGVDSTIRSMLVMAGANRARTSEADGLLTAFELVGGPDFRATHLVVLVACSSGVDFPADDGGAQGMRRALQICGARCIIASLFDVPALSTLDLMRMFHDTWLAIPQAQPNIGAATSSRIDAFRSAKLGVLQHVRATNQSGHPLWWSGFEYFGDPGTGPLPSSLLAGSRAAESR